MKRELLLTLAVLLLSSTGGGIRLLAQTWEKVALSDIARGDTIVIMDSTAAVAMSNDGGTTSLPSCVSVTLNDDGDKIAGTVADNIKWTLKDTTYTYTDGSTVSGYIFYAKGDTTTWLYGASTGNAKSLYVGTDETAKVFVPKDTVISSKTYHTLYCPGVGRYIALNSTTDWRSYNNVNSNVKNTTFNFFRYNSAGVSQTQTTLTFTNTAYTFSQGTGEQTITNSATLAPTEAANAGSITYTSSDSTIAKPNSDGTATVYTTTAGSATITATYAENDSYYGSTASYTIEVVYAAPEGAVADTITCDSLAATSTTYTSFSYTSPTSGVPYQGKSAKGNSAIQLNSTNPYGMVSVGAAKLTAVVVVFNSSTTTGRTVDIYGKGAAYTGDDAADLYNSSSSTKGTKIGSATYDGSNTTYTIEVGEDDAYYYAGLRSNSSALYLDKVIFVWDGTTTVIGEEDSTTKGAAESVDVTLLRTLSADYLNTFCVPFDITKTQIESVLGSDALVEEFKSVSGTTLTFEAAESISAGKPYLVKPTTTVTNPTFEGVSIQSDEPTTVTIDSYGMTGIYSPLALKTDSTQAFLGDGDALYYPSADDYTMPGLRAYFTLPSTVSSGEARVQLTIDDIADDSQTTSISTIDRPTVAAYGAIYDISGRPVGSDISTLPAGLYIAAGKKIIIR